MQFLHAEQLTPLVLMSTGGNACCWLFFWCGMLSCALAAEAEGQPDPSHPISAPQPVDTRSCNALKALTGSSGILLSEMGYSGHDSHCTCYHMA